MISTKPSKQKQQVSNTHLNKGLKVIWFIETNGKKVWRPKPWPKNVIQKTKVRSYLTLNEVGLNKKMLSLKEMYD